jgi:hypothetical protein
VVERGCTQSEVEDDITPRFKPRQFHELHRDVTIRALPGRAPGPAVDYIRSNLARILKL